MSAEIEKLQERAYEIYMRCTVDRAMVGNPAYYAGPWNYKRFRNKTVEEIFNLLLLEKG
mgnify:CR=1 FL=1